MSLKAPRSLFFFPTHWRHILMFTKWSPVSKQTGTIWNESTKLLFQSRSKFWLADNKRSFLSSELLLNYQLEFISEFSFSIKERKPNFSGKQHAEKKHIMVKLLQKRREKSANNEETLGKECQIFWKHLKEIYFWMFWWYVILN